MRATGFAGVFLVEAQGDGFELAERVSAACADAIGRVLVVAARVPSEVEPIREAAVGTGLARIAPDESFCFRVCKRGAHELREQTPALEYEIGGAIWEALQRERGQKPKVDLEHADVEVRAEVLGPETVVAVGRRHWWPRRARRVEEDEEEAMQGEPHDLRHEFPEHADRIERLRGEDPEVSRSMDEYDLLDAQIRELEARGEPVSDTYMEDLKKRRVLLKDQLFAGSRAARSRRTRQRER